MKNTRFNVSRAGGAINDSDSYASEIGTTQGANSFHNSSMKQSTENFGTLGKLTEKSSKLDEKTSGTNQGSKNAQ